MRRGLRIDPDCLAERLPNLIAPGQSAGKSTADTDTDLAGCLLAEPWVEGHQLENIDRLKLQTIRNPIHTTIINESKVILPQMQEWKGGAPLGDRIVGYRLVDLGQKVGRDLIGLTGARRNQRRCSMLVHEAL